MSCAPHCCPGPHLLITICHLSCALYTPPPLSSNPHYPSSTCPLPPSCWFQLIPLSPLDFSTDSPHNTLLSICCLSVCCSVLCTCSLSWYFSLHLHLQLLHCFPPTLALASCPSSTAWSSILSGFSP